MIWTKQLPTETEWYWLRAFAGGDVIVKIMASRNGDLYFFDGLKDFFVSDMNRLCHVNA